MRVKRLSQPNLLALLVETSKLGASCFHWRFSMFDISCDASTVRDTFIVKGSNTSTAEIYWISSTVQFAFSSSSKTLLLIQGNFNKCHFLSP